MKPDIAEIAKKRLSKWAARLFDPNRPRGLIETPEIIPLNDEFLSAFGKRSRVDDEEHGQNIVIDNSNLDEDEPDEEGKEEPTTKKARKSKGGVTAKVKLSNLPYEIAQDYLHRRCEKFGSVLLTNIIMNDSGKPSGRAYVTFEEMDSAVACIEAMNGKSFQGRVIIVSIAADNKKSRKSGGFEV